MAPGDASKYGLSRCSFPGCGLIRNAIRHYGRKAQRDETPAMKYLRR